MSESFGVCTNLNYYECNQKCGQDLPSVRINNRFCGIGCLRQAANPVPTEVQRMRLGKATQSRERARISETRKVMTSDVCHLSCLSSIGSLGFSSLGSVHSDQQVFSYFL